MESLDRVSFTASCLSFSHYILLLYGALARVADVLFYVFTFFTGITSILLFSATKYIYEDKRVFGNLVVIGTTTFMASVYLSKLVNVFASVFQWAIYIAFWLGSTHSMVVVDMSEYRKRNVIYGTLNLLLNVLYEIL